jgi:tellurium resistance protein TerZ
MLQSKGKTMIDLNKTTGIILEKRQEINLTKTASKGLSQVCFGLDWGMIENKGFMGFGGSKEKVDLDASVAVLDSKGNVITTVYFSHREAYNGKILHSGDDRGGDDGDDGKDNETIVCNLATLPNEASKLVFFMNSYSGQTFDKIPYAKIRVYTGTPNNPTEVLGTMNVANESAFSGKTAMYMASAYRDANGEWQLKAIGTPSTGNVHRLAESAKNNS